MALSGFLLYLDKALAYLNISIPVPSKFEAIGWDQSLFVWFSMQTLMPILICIGAWYRAYKVSIFIPLYAFILQGYFLLFDAKIIDDTYLSLYTLGTMLLLVFSIQVIKNISRITLRKQVKKAKAELLNERV